MPIVNRISALHEEVTGWRRDIHEYPELMFDVHRTAAFVAEVTAHLADAPSAWDPIRPAG